MKQVTVLGATGSVGVSTLDVISRSPDRFKVFALTANQSIARLEKQILQHHPLYAVVQDEQVAALLRASLKGARVNTKILSGAKALAQVASDDAVDYVMAAIVGAAGLLPTLAAAQSGKRVLLANKEALVMSGDLFMRTVMENNAELLPIDSEHNAIFQCLPRTYFSDPENSGIKKIILTGSGGPFRLASLSSLKTVTPEQACAHPNWNMGKKISVDSATMMNKGLELIEACYLFSLDPRLIDIVIHPQSIIHSMAQYIDGSVVAQLGNPDMRTPIAHALAWPERIESGVADLDMIVQARLDFEAPDYQRFPCLKLAQDAIRLGGAASVTLNAANEIAVAAFLSSDLAFTQIAQTIAYVQDNLSINTVDTVDQIIDADNKARDVAHEYIQQIASEKS